MDEDPIGGAITFLEENGYRENAQIIDIDNIWFNGLFEICCNEKVVLGHLREQLEKKVDEKNQYIQTQLEKLISCGDGFISAKHAQNFEIVCKEYHYNLNRGLGNGLIQEGQELQIGDCKIKVLSPGKERINNFAKWIDKNLIDCLGDNYQLKKTDFLDYLEKVVLVYGKDAYGSEGYSEISSNCPNIESWIGTSRQAPMNAANRMSIVLDLSLIHI